MARIVYRGGSDTDDNLTPRSGRDEQGKPGRTPGLSAFVAIGQAVEPGGKAQGIDLDQLAVPLRPFYDDPNLEGGVMGHLSIAPATPDGRVDRTLLNEWAATRKTARVHWLTTALRDAIVRPAIRRTR